jgi:uncharacterized protein (DUF1015 family)
MSLHILLQDVRALQKAFASVGTMYIADGHHRIAAAHKYANTLSVTHYTAHHCDLVVSHTGRV